ncbi:MAG TPA: signal recognition particle protein [Gammaproteobacteria bacterium]|nr:signal recognition particle protein [Gammaproteobacteria bacterium]
MFENLSERLGKTLRNLTGKGKLSVDNIQETLGEVRKSLLDADVALSVVDAFIETLQAKAIGQEVDPSLSPGQFFVKLVKDELVLLMGQANQSLNLQAKPPVVILVAGLQGSGKTTSCAKLAKFLQDQQKKSVMMVSCDIYRPAAIQQLASVAEQVGASVFPSESTQQPVTIVKNALDAASKAFKDVLIVDTAGRLHIDQAMMEEVKQVHAACNPTETLFVVDSMTGQDAANTAQAFNAALPLTGVILTKIDGDARGGAALSIRQITGKPIKFMGVGEKLDALEPFYPDRVASRILGMGDVLSLIDEIERKVDKEKADKLSKKLAKGKGFDLNDLREQLQQMVNMGGMAAMLDKLPNMPGMVQKVKTSGHEKQFNTMIYVIDSMTKKERERPAIILGSRKRRIADGSGTSIQDVNRVLKQHEQMQKMMKKMSNKAGMMKMMRGMQGRLPPGFM